jgi:hypothetical protein
VISKVLQTLGLQPRISKKILYNITIDTITIFYTVGQNNFGNKIPKLCKTRLPCDRALKLLKSSEGVRGTNDANAVSKISWTFSKDLVLENLRLNSRRNNSDKLKGKTLKLEDLMTK